MTDNSQQITQITDLPQASTPLATDDIVLIIQQGIARQTAQANLTTGTVSVSGSPTAGNLTKFSSATSVTNGDLTGVVATSGSLVTSFGSFSSATLAAAVTDKTGSGSLVFSTSPTLITPNLGTPTSLVGTNITGTATGLTSGTVTTINGLITQGTNVTITGSGTSLSPYNISTSNSIFQTYIAKTSNYTLLTTDYCVEATSGTFTITLPTAVSVTGKAYVVKNSGTGAITINSTSSQTIDGQLTQVLNIQYQSLTVLSNGTNWIIIA